jgi:hypothetical protein
MELVACEKEVGKLSDLPLSGVWRLAVVARAQFCALFGSDGAFARLK